MKVKLKFNKKFMLINNKLIMKISLKENQIKN